MELGIKQLQQGFLDEDAGPKFDGSEPPINDSVTSSNIVRPLAIAEVSSSMERRSL